MGFALSPEQETNENAAINIAQNAQIMTDDILSLFFFVSILILPLSSLAPPDAPGAKMLRLF